MIETYCGDINNGRQGFPNIQAQLNWSECNTRVHAKAIASHVTSRGCELAHFKKEGTGKNLAGHKYTEYTLHIRSNETNAEKSVTMRLFPR